MDKELDALARASARGQNIYVMKEAATALGLIKTEPCVKLLTTRLAEVEATLLRSDTSLYPMEEMQKRIAGDLLRRVFGGSAKQMLVGALGAQSSSKEELAEIRAIVEALEKKKRGSK